MYNQKNKWEIDLTEALNNFFKNKNKIIIALLAGICLAIFHYHYFKKPFVPIYQIKVEIESVSIYEEVKYDPYNNIGQILSISLFDVIPLMNLDVFPKINAAYLMRIFIDTLKEDSIKKLILKKAESVFDIDSNSQSNNEFFSIISLVPAKENKDAFYTLRISSNDGDNKKWELFIKEIEKIINDEVKIYISNRINNNIVKNFKLINDYSNVIRNTENLQEKFNNNIHQQIEVSKYLLNQFIKEIETTPMALNKKFVAAKIKDQSLDIKIINHHDKGMGLIQIILLYLIIIFVLSFSFILTKSYFKNQKKR